MLLNEIFRHFLKPFITRTFLLTLCFCWIDGVIIFDLVGQSGLLLSLSFVSAESLDGELFLAIMTQLLNLLIKVLLYPKCFTKATNFLLHLVGHTYRYKVALVFLGIVHTNIVITSLLLGSAVRVEAAGFVFDVFVLAFENSFFDACLLVLFVDIKFHLLQLVAIWHVLWEADKDRLIEICLGRLSYFTSLDDLECCRHVFFIKM